MSKRVNPPLSALFYRGKMIKRLNETWQYPVKPYEPIKNLFEFWNFAFVEDPKGFSRCSSDRNSKAGWQDIALAGKENL